MAGTFYGKVFHTISKGNEICAEEVKISSYPCPVKNANCVKQNPALQVGKPRNTKSFEKEKPISALGHF